MLIPWPATRLAQIVAGAGFIVLIALVGHAGATPGTAGDIHLASDMAHLLAAGAWLGGLPALAMLLAATSHANDPAWRGFAVARDPAVFVARNRLRGCPYGDRHYQ